LLILFIALFLSMLHRLARRHGIAEETLERFWFRDCLFYVFGAVCQQGACFIRCRSHNIGLYSIEVSKNYTDRATAACR
jgi:hypothetical protein